MQKKFFQFIFSILLIGGGFFAYSAQAGTIYNTGGTADTFGATAIPYYNLYPTNFGSDKDIASISLYIHLDDCSSSALFYISGGGVNHYATNPIAAHTVYEGLYSFTFSSSDTVHLATTTFSGGGIDGSCASGGQFRLGYIAATYAGQDSVPFALYSFDNIGITTPSEFSTVQNNTTVTVTGFCPTNGENQVALTTNNPVGNPNNYIYSLDCVGNEFTGDISVGSKSQYCISAIDYSSGEVSASTCIFANATGIATGSNIFFMSPPMYNNTYTGSDFQTWQLGVGLPPANLVSSYYYTVVYGTSSTSPTYTDSLKDQIGSLPVSTNEQLNGLSQLNLPLNKLNGTASSTIYAKAYLYDQNNATIASSSILTLTFDNGTSTPYANNNNQSSNKLNCNPTDFGFSIPSLSPVINSPYLDIGQGFCKMYVATLVPEESDFTQFSDLWTTIKAKPPFGYFTQTQQTLSGFNTSTPAVYTLPSMNGISFLRDLVDNALAFLVVLSFAFFIFHRFRLLDFHH